MSRNNLIAVINYKKRYYVFGPLCADIPLGFDTYDDYLKSHINDSSKYTLSWRNALFIAHRLNNQFDTEYGVQNYRINP